MKEIKEVKCMRCQGEVLDYVCCENCTNELVSEIDRLNQVISNIYTDLKGIFTKDKTKRTEE